MVGWRQIAWSNVCQDGALLMDTLNLLPHHIARYLAMRSNTRLLFLVRSSVARLCVESLWKRVLDVIIEHCEPTCKLKRCLKPEPLLTHTSPVYASHGSNLGVFIRPIASWSIFIFWFQCLGKFMLVSSLQYIFIILWDLNIFQDQSTLISKSSGIILIFEQPPNITQQVHSSWSDDWVWAA